MLVVMTLASVGKVLVHRAQPRSVTTYKKQLTNTV